MTTRLLIRGACVITVDPALGTLPRADILIEDDRIAAVGPELAADGAEVIDGEGMIAMPGLIDTHRHLWMTLLRGFVSDGPWSSYLVKTFWGRRPLFRAEDRHVATLAGALEALDAGVTTVLDFSDCSVAEGHADAALDALDASGVRVVFGYGLGGAPQFGNGTAIDVEALSPTMDWHRAEATRLRAGRLSDDDGLVTMGITARNLEYLPWSCTEHDLGLARELGVRTITTHAGFDPAEALAGGSWVIDHLDRHGMLGPDLVFSHGQYFTDTELDRLAATGVSIAVSVESELGQGADPVTWRAIQHGVTIALGADSVGSLSGDMFRHMQFTLKVGRGSRARLLDAQGIAPTDVKFTAREVLEIATMGGAKALRMDDRVGSLTPGKQADVVLLSTDRIGMMSGAEPEQIAVLQANGGDVDSVFVAGRPLKRAGCLLDVDRRALAQRLEDSRQRLDAAYAEFDSAQAWDTYYKLIAAN